MRPAQKPDRTFIACEYFDESGRKSGGCGALYHPRCVGTSRKIVDGIGEFKCPLCVRKAKERDAQNSDRNGGSSGLSPSDVEMEEAKWLQNWKRSLALTQKPLCLALSNASVIQGAASPIATLPGANWIDPRLVAIPR